ncbi:MAG: hypothetical protein A2413_16190 [Treponema sp. RIFOXYC1_FULL_61_9]|nr:MAG: hypothetical protein A2001_02040 [Treponema sp. GWC1_61_84]OHE76345.1 MAG: hypothetical protein A2413_16190 [Treponema sp. RIFOXYC1_FULL_61_9]
MNPLSEFWIAVFRNLRFALQPIVNIHSGAVYGFEALLRGFEAAGFAEIPELFDAAFKDGVLYALDYRLREKALTLFRDLDCRKGAKLFYNLDNRVTEMPDYSPGNTMLLLERLGLEPSSIVFEVSERHEFSDYAAARKVLSQYKNQDFRIALDDFGAGFSGLQLLYFAEPDVLKIDRFFIDGLDANPRKRLFAERIVSLAHLMGLHVVAEGVETEGEFHACRKIGCDLVQGFLVARPTLDVAELRERYPLVGDLVNADRRNGAAGKSMDVEALVARIDPIRPVRVGESILDVLERFRRDDAPAMVPVLDGNGECVGVLHERDFRKFVYSPFGISLLKHAASTLPFAGLLSRVPVADASAEIRTIQDLFLASSMAGGVVVYEDGAYSGFLDARSILAAVSEKDLVEARDQNPLTKLPGNARLDKYLAEACEHAGTATFLCYFDFNDFKPFNDRYGFRRGDRVILLFADILRDYASRNGWFLAHIGGDDFFAGIPHRANEKDDAQGRGEMEAVLREVLDRFAGSVASFYDEADRARGWIETPDRSDNLRRFPMLSVSVGVLRLSVGEDGTDGDALPFDQLGETLAGLKKRAKASGGYSYREANARA